MNARILEMLSKTEILVAVSAHSTVTVKTHILLKYGEIIRSADADAQF
jgi:hypothetical protein